MELSGEWLSLASLWLLITLLGTVDEASLGAEELTADGVIELCCDEAADCDCEEASLDGSLELDSVVLGEESGLSDDR